MIRTILEYRRWPSRDQREFAPMVRECFMETALHWAKEILPRHFEPRARSEYAFARRTARYQRLKAKYVKHQKELVWTGNTETQAEHSAPTKIRATSKGATVRVTVPPYLVTPGGASRKTKRNYDMVRELLAVSSRDDQELGQVFDKAFTARQNQYQSETVYPR